MTHDSVTVEYFRRGTLVETRPLKSWDAAHGYIASQCDGKLPKPQHVSKGKDGRFHTRRTRRVYAYGDLKFSAEGPDESVG